MLYTIYKMSGAFEYLVQEIDDEGFYTGIVMMTALASGDSSGVRQEISRVSARARTPERALYIALEKMTEKLREEAK